MRTIVNIGLVVVGLALASNRACAQGAPSFGRSVEQLAATVDLAEASTGERAPAAADLDYWNSSHDSRREGTVLMIVGAAGLITGLIIDEDIVTIAGAGVAGVGLYLFLRNGGKVEVGAYRPLPALAS